MPSMRASGDVDHKTRHDKTSPTSTKSSDEERIAVKPPVDVHEASERRRLVWRVLQVALSVALVAGVFLVVLPRMADFSEVWSAVIDMTWREILTLAVAALWNILTYLFVMMAAMPGLSLTEAFVVGQSSTAVATALPAGSALGIGVTYAMYSSTGRSGPEIALAAVLTGVWNNFVKMGLPVIALALLVVQGKAGPGLVSAAIAGVLTLATAIAIFALMLRSSELAARTGAALGVAISFLRRLIHRPAVDWADAAIRFRRDTIDLLRGRWIALTAATVLSHLSLFLVLLLALRHMGVSDAEVSWTESLGVFALIRLVTALPITPGGLGLVELGLTAGLVLAGGAEAGVIAAVLIYRFLTLILQVPIGAISYLVWRHSSSLHGHAI
jgi:putative heme transporter